MRVLSIGALMVIGQYLSTLHPVGNLYKPHLRRILRFAIIYHRVFQERNAGFVTHSAASRRLVDFPLPMDALGAQFDEAWQVLRMLVEELPSIC